jgi:Domain of unknown function (DUF1611_C) P-loop domain
MADLDRHPPTVEPRPREEWATGDVVVGEMLDTGPDSFRVETPTGAYQTIRPADRIVGALGTRAATLEAVGDWREVGEDLVLDTLTAAGVLGRCISRAASSPPMIEVRYMGHAIGNGKACTMSGSVGQVPERKLEAPVVLIIGTSMDAGKTVTATAIVRELTGMGMRVAGAKLTGVGRYRDILAMREAGADYIADFVDAGLPSTVVPSGEFEQALKLLCSKLAAAEPDVVVAEAGASPLEPYNGDVAMRVLADNVRAIVLCASDPYAVVGVMSAFGTQPDLVAGRATSTAAAIDLVDKLVSLPAINMLDEASGPKLASFLREWLR